MPATKSAGSAGVDILDAQQEAAAAGARQVQADERG